MEEHKYHLLLFRQPVEKKRKKQAMSVSELSTISTQISTSYSIYPPRVAQSIRVLTAARKRKFDCRSGGNSKRKMTLVDVAEIFRQLRFARYGEGQFSKFKNWRDERLWKNLLDVLIDRRSFPINLKTLVLVVSAYAKKYDKDTSVGWLDDSTLRRDVIAVFKSEHLVDQKGCLSIDDLQVIIRNMNDSGLLVDDEEVDESSYRGRNYGGRKTVKRLRGSGSSSSSSNNLLA